MDFQNARIGEPAHQGLAHPGRIGAGPGGKQQGFGHGFDGQGHYNLVGDFGRLTVAGASHPRDVLAHQCKQGLYLLERRLLAADHDGQGSVLGPHLAS